MITLQVLNAHGRRRAPRTVLMRAAHAALRGEGVRNASIGIVCLNDRQCRRLNRKHLGHDYTTDVLSFPLEQSPALEGEVYVNLDRARQQRRLSDWPPQPHDAECPRLLADGCPDGAHRHALHAGPDDPQQQPHPG